MSLLELEGVSKHFGDIVAVDNASFDVVDGEFVSILGPSGSGKSTILRMIAGFETPTKGEIRIKNRNVVGVPSFERDVNMVFQSLALFPHLSVSENIAYGLKNRGVPKAERKERVENMLEMVRLQGYGDRNPTQLSGGEQQRVALSRAIVNEPEIVLFDEPLASLDRKLRQQMQVELQRIQSETDITFLYVTHDQQIAMSVSDRMVLLNDGEIEQIGAAEELYETPASQFVADFIGDVNTLPGEISQMRNGYATIDIGVDEFDYDADWIVSNGNTLGVGLSVTVCIRPQNIEIHDSSENLEVKIPGRVINRIYRGNEVSYILETDLATLMVNTNTDRFRIDDQVYATWSDKGTHVFVSEGTVEAQGAGIGGL